MRLVYLPTLLITALLSAVLLTAWLYIYPKNLEQNKAIAELNVRSNFAADVAFLQTQIDNAQTEEIREFISSTAVVPGLSSMTLIDPSGVIIASTSIEIEGENITSQNLSDWLAATSFKKPEFNARDNLIDAYAHVHFNHQQGEHNLGMIHAEFDLTPVYAVADSNFSNIVLTLAAALIFGGLIAHLISYRLIGKRLEVLVSDVRTAKDLPDEPLFLDDRDDEIGIVSKTLRQALVITEEHRRLANRLTVAVRATRAGIFEINMASKTFVGNYQLFEMLGVKAQNTPLPIAFIRRRVHQHHRRRLLEAARSAQRSNIPVEAEIQFRHANGQYVWINLTLKLDQQTKGASAPLLVGLTQDISAKRQQEQQIRDNNNQLIAAFDSLTIGIVIADEKGEILQLNSSACQIFGYEEIDLAGQNVEQLMPQDIATHHSGYLEAFLQTGVKNIIGEPRFLTGIRKNGELFPLQLTVGIFKGSGRRAYVSSITDLTQLKDLEGQLYQSQKMEAVGQLAGGIAHDFNNLLQIVRGHTDLALANASENQQTHLETIRNASERATQLTQQLLSFSRQQVMSPQYVDLKEICVDNVKLLERLLGDQINIEFKSDNDAAVVYADRSMLGQIIMNLAVNARDAMTEGGTISIDLAAATLDDTNADKFHCLSVTDTGSGLSEETRLKMFEPFYSTKARGAGTGLGLSIVNSIVSQHQGHIGVSSEIGNGTTISVYLPAAQSQPKAPAASEPEAATGQGQKVLVIDDNSSVQRLVDMLLTSGGYRVITADSGEEALRLFKAEPGISLVLTDLMMPGMNGYETAALLREIRNVPIIFSSGDPEKVQQVDSSLQENSLMLLKPYTRDDLLKSVHQVLTTFQAGSTKTSDNS